jgi:thiol-disulfide isomerase/thioredoxin
MKYGLCGALLLSVLTGCAGSDAEKANVGTTANSSELVEKMNTESPQPDQPTPTAAAEPSTPVDVKILSYDEIQKLIASHKGKVVIMDAWSTSCEPCVEEFPNLVALHKKYGPDKVACISLSFDYEGIGKPADVVPVVKEFLAKQGATFDNVVSSDDSETLYKKMQLASVPAVYVYNQQGELAKRFDNEMIEKEEDAFNYQHVGKLVAELVEQGQAAE